MATVATQCSPHSNRTSSSHFGIHEDDTSTNNGVSLRQTSMSSKHTITGEGSLPLITSKLGNIQASAIKKLKVDHGGQTPIKDERRSVTPMDALLAKLSQHQSTPNKEKPVRSTEESNVTSSNTDRAPAHALPTSSSDSPPTSGILDIKLASENPKINDQPMPTEFNEMIRLKKELDAAKDKIARQEKELHANWSCKQNVSQPKLTVDSTINSLQDNFMAFHRQGPSWSPVMDDARSDISDAMSSGSMHRGSAWGNLAASHFGQVIPPSNIWSSMSSRPWNNRSAVPNLPPLIVPSQQQAIRPFPGQISPASGGRRFQQDMGGRRGNHSSSRVTSAMSSGSSWQPYGSGEISPTTINSIQGSMHSPLLTPPMGMFQAPMAVYQPRPIGTPLSPTAAEFGADMQGSWDGKASSPTDTYISPTEPLNYRRLLDRSVSCNWKYIVDKIVQNNDQQASIFLQQKLKVGTAEQKFEIVEAIVAQAYPLMVNRFGNFLVQRCFEHGTPDQVIAIANAIRGNTLSLSMDAFGCHVVQKAFDAVPEEYKAIMVHELLRRIPETVIHRYACHVWQKLFELRWSDSPPQIMKYVNDALRGMWHDVALGETGSLVVQNIFENCVEEDKRPCINEVLQSIDIVAHGQFGNWCIQHICEHGAHADRTRAIDHVLKYATEYSMDQYASKVVEKCLKIGGSDFLERYLARVCEGRPDRPRIPLIDIASDQYGNYLIQYILTHANSNHREIVASHIRKHMVSLRGSKFGSRVGMLCSNPAYATRPGPGMGTQTTRYTVTAPIPLPGPVPRYGSSYR